MHDSQFYINWTSYLDHVSKGFSSLQQNAEFVDMTLAAEGHLVKVHQNVVALASPYLKAMLQSASCQHPVIFLNNISHETLGYLLEYIYTGEVKIPMHIADIFIAACRSLCISGISNIDPKNVPTNNHSDSCSKRIDNPPQCSAPHITISTKENNFDMEFVPNDNNATEATDIMDIPEEITPNPTDLVNNDDMRHNAGSSQIVDNITVNKNNIDMDSINDFVIIKPRNTCPTDMNTNIGENPLTLFGVDSNNTTNNLPTWQENIDTQEQNISTSTENLINIIADTNLTDNSFSVTLDPNHWFSQSNQNISDIDLNTRIAVHPENTITPTNPENTIIPIETNTLISSNAVKLNTIITTNPANTIISTKPVNTTNLTNPNNIIIPTIEENPVTSKNPVNILSCLSIKPIQTCSDEELNTNPINITLSTEDWQYQPGESTSQVESNANTNPTDEQTKSSNTVNITLDKKVVYKNIKKIGTHMKFTKTQEKNLAKLTQTKAPKVDLDNNVPHYTISNRGALQLVLNHFMYCSHHYSSGGRKKRWRCINYRKLHCPAFIDTNDEEMIAISAEHDHPNHDNEIRKKIKSNIIFTSLSIAVQTIENLLRDKPE